MPGPPSTFTEEVFAEILLRMSGGETISSICRSEGMPHRDTFRMWRGLDPSYHQRYLEAKQAGYDAIADDCLDIADDGSRDYKPNADGALVADHDHIQRSKLRVDTRLKLLAKWASGTYADKIHTEHSGTVGVKNARELTEAELETIAAGAIHRG